MTKRRVGAGVAVVSGTLYVVGGDDGSYGGPIQSLEILPLAPRVVYAPLHHWCFPAAFRSAVLVLLLCGARLDVLPDDLLILILSMLNKDSF